MSTFVVALSDAQREETEALQAILGDDFCLQKDETTGRPLIKLNLLEESPRVELSLYLSLPPSYPEECPSITIQPGKDFPATWRSPLLEFLKNEINSMVATPMVFELYTRAKDWILEHSAQLESEDIDKVMSQGFSATSVVEKMKQESSFSISSLVEEREYGTPVTKETFEQWRQNFFLQFGVRNKEKEGSSKPTGRQLFEENRLVETSEAGDIYSSEDEE